MAKDAAAGAAAAARDANATARDAGAASLRIPGRSASSSSLSKLSLDKGDGATISSKDSGAAVPGRGTTGGVNGNGNGNGRGLAHASLSKLSLDRSKPTGTLSASPSMSGLLSPPPALSATATGLLKRSDSATSELESAFLKQPLFEHRMERQKQRTSRKWLRMDYTGRTSIVHADKLQIAEQTGIQLRDLRLLDPMLATSYPSAVLARDAALVLNLEFIKAVVTPQAVLILNAEESNAINFVETLERRLFGRAPEDAAAAAAAAAAVARGDVEDQVILMAGSPFELRALEVALEMVCQHLAREAQDLEAAALPALDALTTKVDTQSLERVRRVKTRLVRLKTRVSAVKELIGKYLEDDEDMKDLNLTAKQADGLARTMTLQRMSMDTDGRGAQPGSPQEGAAQAAGAEAAEEAEEARLRAEDESLDLVEQLLEAYFMQVSSTEQRLGTLYEYVDDTEDYIEMDQDSHRNQLIQLDLLATAGLISMSFITILTGFFSMNLNSRARSMSDFWIVSMVSLGLCLGSFVMFLYYCWHKKLMFH